MKKTELWLAMYDTHYPLVHVPTFRAILDFMKRNKLDGFLFGGDQFDNQELSPHTRGKPMLRDQAGFLNSVRGFDREILRPIEALLPAGAQRIYLEGNHDHWTQQFIQENPELDGLQQHKLLDIEKRGWKFVPCGQHFRKGKLTFIHGEQLSGFGNQSPTSHAKRALDIYSRNIVYGHLHSPQSHTKVLPYNEADKWQAWCSPIVGMTNPQYLRNRPTAWLNGFTLVEFHGDGYFNVFPCIVTNGRFSYGSVVYGSGTRRHQSKVRPRSNRRSK